MQWFSELFMSHTALQAVIIISVIIAFGLALGKIRVWGISLGVTFVFFAGILAGHIGLSIDPTILHYTENLGLVLFVYELGLKVGPGFFSSFRKGGLELNMLGLGVLAIGTLMAVLCTLASAYPSEKPPDSSAEPPPTPRLSEPPSRHSNRWDCRPTVPH